MGGDQEFMDQFYWEHGPCCAGCDWWQSGNTFMGACTATVPVDGVTRGAMIGIRYISADVGCGHIMTKRDHHCGSFKDEFDWSSLPLAYRKRVGAPVCIVPITERRA